VTSFWQPPAGVNASAGNFYDIFIDGKQYVLQLKNNSYFYTIATGLSASNVHSLLISKRTEPYIGSTYFMGVSVDNNATLLPPPARSSRRIEFLGDSITCGYGNLGVPPCNFTPVTEENYVSYGPVTARALNAEYHLEAWSGIGLVRNYNDSKLVSDPNFPDFFNRTIAAQGDDYWNFTSWIPDAVVINLGTNDYGPLPYPNNTFWIESYGAFATYIRSEYGKDVVIFAVCGPMISGQCCQNVQAAAQAYDLVYIDMENILDPSTDIGCNGHPNAAGHAKMSFVALPIIQKTMQW